MDLLDCCKSICLHILISIYIVLGCGHLTAQESQDNSLFIVTPSWKNFTEKDGSGFYFDLMRLVFEPEGIQISHQITPWARCELLVSSKKADALLGSYKEKMQLYNYPNYAIWIDISSVAFKRGKFEWHGTTSLKDKKVAWIRGYRYDSYLDIRLQIYELSDNSQAWQMLELDRIDFYLDSLTDMKLFIKENAIDHDKYEIQNVITKQLYVRFAKTEKGKRLADIYDKRILRLYENGQLERLYLKWGYKDYFKAFESNL